MKDDTRCHVIVVRSLGVTLFLALTFLTGRLAGAADQEPDESGEDFTRPSSRFDFRDQFQEKSGDVAQNRFILRLERPIPLDEAWKIGTRIDLPFVLSNGASSDNPNGNVRFGTGEMLLQAVLIDEFTERWGAGAGPRMILPTASEDQFGSGKLQLGPIGGVRCKLPEISKGSFAQLVVRYECDVAGDSSRSHISRIRWSPTVNVALPRDWFVTFFPSQDIAVNFMDDRKWFVPFDFLIGKNLSSRD